MITIRVPLGESVQIVNAKRTRENLPDDEQPLTMQEWSTLANVCGAFVDHLRHADAESKRFVTALRDKCIARRNALSDGEAIP